MKIPNSFWYNLALLLCIPAFFINLDLITLNEDEAIRALVALEMRLSGDFLTPTLNGTLYYAKPPLYNWILNIFFVLTGQITEFSLRLPTIVFLGFFGWSIYHYSSKYYDRQYAFINTFLFITCGRVLFWDSMLGYIDICYSWITFVNLMVIFHMYQHKKMGRLFFVSTFLAAIGFMLKGFPTIIFQGLSLVVFFGYQKDFKRLFSKAHLLSILLFSGLIVSYYLYYFNANENFKVLDSLLDQSTRRTLMHDQHSIGDFFKHLVSYPFENLYHFFPWSIMIIYLIRKRLWVLIGANEFLKYCTIIFGVNILVYWVSIEVYPRYILMLIPLAFSVFLYFHRIHYMDDSKLYKVFIVFMMLVILTGAGLSTYFMFWDQVNDVAFPVWKSLSISIPLLLIALYFYQHKSQRLISAICALLIIRIGFNFFVLPDRHQNDLATEYKRQAIEIGMKYKDKDLRIFDGTKIDYTSSFYITNTRSKISHRDYEHLESAYYVIDKSRYQIPLGFEEIEEFQIREQNKILTIISK